MRDYPELLKQLRFCPIPGSCHHCIIDADKCHRKTSKISLYLQAVVAIEELLSELEEYKRSDKLAVKTIDSMAGQLASAPRWISVEERLPEIDTSVLMCAFGKSVGEGTYRGYDGVHHVWKMDAVAGTYWDDEVTHWMPLPTSPGGAE